MTITELPQSAFALAEAARAMHSQQSVDDTLQAIAVAAQSALPGFEHVGVSIVHRNGELETRASTGQLVSYLDALQYRLGEGPCVDAIREGPVTLVPDLSTETRWPSYVREAMAAGLRAQFGLKLYDDKGTLGGLNLYSTSSEGIDPDAVQFAELFAAHASIALGRARYEHQLNESVTSRQMIGTAVGILMQRYQLTEARAFQYLVRTSSTSNVKLRVIAQGLVDAANESGSRSRITEQS